MACQEATREKERQGSEELREGFLNVGSMTGKGGSLPDVMERRTVAILCGQGSRQKGSKAGALELDIQIVLVQI